MWSKEGLIVGTIITVFSSCSAFSGIVLNSLASGERIDQALIKGSMAGLPLVFFGLMTLLKTKGHIQNRK